MFCGSTFSNKSSIEDATKVLVSFIIKMNTTLRSFQHELKTFFQRSFCYFGHSNPLLID